MSGTATRVWLALVVATALIARACTAGEVPSPEAVNAFRQWLQAINVSMDAMVWPVQTSNGISAVASRFLNPGEPLCELPPRFLLSTLAFENNRKLNSLRPLPWRKYAPHDTSYQQRLRLALVLLHEVEQGARSPWAPYIGILPRHPYPHWSASELAEFQDEELPKAFKIRDDEIYNEFDVVRQAMDAAVDEKFDPAVYSRENWIWARETVDTRAHSVAEDDSDLQPSALCFVPLCDLFKHSSHEPWVPRFVDVRPPVPDPWMLSVRYVSLALKPLQRSTELLMRHFQEADNTMFLVVYGFSERDNPYDRARIGNRVLPAHLTDEQLFEWCAEDHEHETPFAVLETCKEVLGDALRAFPTSLAEDEALLTGSGRSTPLLFRLWRKRIVDKHLRRLDKIEASLDVLLQTRDTDAVLDRIRTL